jgi:hypothetical protein
VMHATCSVLSILVLKCDRARRVATAGSGRKHNVTLLTSRDQFPGCRMVTRKAPRAA